MIKGKTSMQTEPTSGTFYKKNIDLLKLRFPELFLALKETLLPDGMEPAPAPQDMLVKARNGSWTAFWNGSLLHSSYNPEREAEKLIAAADGNTFSTGVFFGAGLGYGPASFASRFPDKNLVIIEPDISRLITAFHAADWEPVFSHGSCILLAAASHPQIIPLLEQLGLEDCHLFRTPSLEMHAVPFFKELKVLIDRNIQKQQINSRTLKVFSRLWFRNICRNQEQMALCTGITAFQGKASDLPALIVAAGPSLDEILPVLPELKKHCIIICVDTALRACLRHGVQPHFVVLADPQYWNARHIDGLSAPESILITETAAYPSVFRFNCKSIHLCSSFFPLGRYVEKQLGSNGKLGTGGSVASTAWDFARYCGCRNIYIAGLDLGFPGKKTHTRGSTFEEKAHMSADRTGTAETFITRALFGANPVTATSYDSTPLLTDNRMSLYAWWFESRNAEYPEVSTKTITMKSLRIPGTGISTAEDIMGLGDASDRIGAFIDEAEAASGAVPVQERLHKLHEVMAGLKVDLEEMEDIASKAAGICQTKCLNEKDYRRVSMLLTECDRKLRQSRAAELTALIMPAKEELKAWQDSHSDPADSIFTRNLQFSGYVYSRIIESIKDWKKNLLK